MLPRFAVALPQDALLQSSPPFDYPGVSMRTFPLRADMTRTQTLVDGWLNDLLPDEVAYFRVFTPFVLLVALNYGKASVIPSNLGWSSQKEVTFSIPLQWYKRGKRGFEFHDFAYLTPFIFVDNDLSIPAGREVFGWQKNLIWMDGLGDRWMSNPRSPLRHAGISTPAFREVYAGKQRQRTAFVDIEEAPPGALFQYPPDLGNPHLPWVSLHNAIDSATELSLDLVNILMGMGLIRRREVPQRRGRKAWLDPSPESILKMVQSTLSSIDPYSPDLYTNEINLKQFRDAERPTMACYQDINCTVMKIKEINRMGLLGEARILAGDFTGGYRVTLHQMESLPIADMLGLDCKRTTSTDGVTVAQIKPVLPMWADMDFGYADERYVLAWRSKEHPWSTGRGAAVPALRRPPEADSSYREAKGKAEIRYNTTLGTSSPVLYGPFETPKATIRVLPLLATPKNLAEVVTRALNEPLRDVELDSGDAAGDSAPGFSFEPWGSYVYFVLVSSEATYSIDNNIGSWPQSMASIVIPVRRFTAGKPDGFALYSAFIFSASSLDSISSSEINGMRVMGAKIDSPQSTWLEENGPAAGRGRDLAVLQVMIPPILNAGERAVTRTLLKVSQRSTDALNPEVARLNHEWAPKLKHDLERRPLFENFPPGASRPERPTDLTIARAHAIDYLADGAPFRFLALKQFRDVARPDRACYQALVEVQQHLSQIERVEEITRPLEVTLFDYASMPIADMLGLVPRSTGYDKGLRYRRFEAIRPFWGLATLHEELGKNLAEQERSFLWARRDTSATPASAALANAGDAERMSSLERIDLGDPRELQRGVTIERATGAPRSEGRLMHSAPLEGDPTAALAAVEPQWVIESILSREWESRARPAWLHHKQRIESDLERRCSKFKAFTVRAYNELQEMKLQRARITAEHHKDILHVIDTLLLPRYAALTWIFAEALHLNEITHGRANAAELGLGAARQGRAGQAAAGPFGPDIHHFSDGAEEQSSIAQGVVDSLYADRQFGAFGKEDADFLHRAESVVLNDVHVGGLLKTLIGLSGEAATGVIQEYATKHPEVVATKRGAAEAPVAGFGQTPQDLFVHFSAGGDEQLGWAGDSEDAIGEYVPPKTADLPRGLAEDLREDKSGSIALMRTLVYLAWDKSHGGEGDKGAAWNSFLETAAREEKEARRALIVALAKCWQKPFFCVRRDTAGSAQIADELFPREHCWQDRNDISWYSPPGEGRARAGRADPHEPGSE